MQSDNTYNGWTNRATWLVNLWLDEAGGAGMDDVANGKVGDLSEEEDGEDFISNDDRDSIIEDVASAIEAWVDEQYDMVPQGLMRDLLDVSGIDYSEIAEHFVDAAMSERNVMLSNKAEA